MQLLHLFVIFQNFSNFANFHVFFVIFQLNLPLLLAPNNYCFQNLVTPPSDGLWVVNQTFIKHDMVYSDFVV